MVETAEKPIETTPWNLHKGWQWIPLGKLCESIVGGGTPDRKNSAYWGGDIYWASVKDLTSDKILTTQESITLQGLENSAAKLVEPGTVVVATRMGLGKVSIAKTRVAINQDLKGLILSPGVFAKYLTLYLRSRASEIERQGSGATVKGIKLNELKAWLIPIPFPESTSKSLDIQRRIVARIEALLAEVRESFSLLDQMRRDTKKFIHAALEELSQSITPTRKPLLDVIESKPRNGWSPKCDDNPIGIPVLKLGAVLRFRYNPNEVKRTSQPVDYNAHYWLKQGDILISRSNTPELVGHAAIYSGDPSPCIYPDLLMRMTVDNSKVVSHFLIYWLQTKEVREYIKSHASGASSTMKKITQDDVCNIPFPTITLDEQLRLASYLDSIQHEVDEMMKILAQDAKMLDLLERSILERAFRGEL